MSSKKCPLCGLVNYVSAEVCKRCNANLKQESVVLPEAAPEDLPIAEPAASLQPLFDLRLVMCPDCDHMVSPHAESCPSCGRFFARYGQQAADAPNRWWWVQTIAWGVIVSGFLGVLFTFFLFLTFIGGANR